MMSTASVIKNVKTTDADVQISRDNQKKINSFAIKNGWMDELKQQQAKNEAKLRNLDDAESDVMALMDEDAKVPIMIGETFMHFDQSEAIEEIECLRKEVKEDIVKVTERMNAIKKEMANLKSELYSTFGDSINLENEEEG